MLAKRIIPCLDIQDGLVVKGVQFRNHKTVGDIVSLVNRYTKEGADELVFYDISASSNNLLVNKNWISSIAEIIDIPFCVAGGIKTLKDVEEILSLGADKISINSPAIEDPYFISRIADRFGIQCVVVGIDSWFSSKENVYQVYQYTGNVMRMRKTQYKTIEWIKTVQSLGAGEVVLNTMNQDGLLKGYDLLQLKIMRDVCKVPLIASGGAGSKNHFYDVFSKSNVEGALAASVFHNKLIHIQDLKKFLLEKGLEIRLC